MRHFFLKKYTFIAVEKKFPQFFPYKISQSNEKLPQNKWLDLSRYNHSWYVQNVSNYNMITTAFLCVKNQLSYNFPILQWDGTFHRKIFLHWLSCVRCHLSCLSINQMMKHEALKRLIKKQTPTQKGKGRYKRENIVLPGNNTQKHRCIIRSYKRKQRGFT